MRWPSARGVLVLGALLPACAAGEPEVAQDTATNDVGVLDAHDATEAGDGAAADVAADASDAACRLVAPYSSKDKICNDCAQAQCCVEVNGCLGDKRCDDDYVNCSLACALTAPSDGGDAGAEVAACLGECAKTYPAGKALYDTAIGCVAAKCPTLCK